MVKPGQRDSFMPSEWSDFAAAVFEGLSRSEKSLPCRFFYDAAGSALFEEITRQPEYYLTRAEAGILEENAAQLVGQACDDMVLVEFGSGSSLKTEILLRHARRFYAYAPIDIAETALLDARRRLRGRFPWLNIRLFLADFSRPLDLPPELARRPKLGFFPGSTIGNFSPPEAIRLLGAFRETLSSGARLIVGVDLRKDARRLISAYDDAEGVTAAFNLNLLSRINRELGGEIDLRRFRHQATYDPTDGRVAMRLVSLDNQSIRIGGWNFELRAGEAIHTENAYKYTVDGFQSIAQAAGWSPIGVRTDKEETFSVHELQAA